MKLQRLILRRMPGFEKTLTLDFGENLTLITGPNGSGKSTICRAVATMLWPGHDTPDPIAVESTWQDGRSERHAERFDQQRRTRWQKNGVPSDAPPLPDDHLAPCFFLGITDLVKADQDENDERLAENILRQMAGGFDLGAVERKLFQPPARHAQGPRARHEESVKRVASLQCERALLAEREDELDDLQRRINEAGVAGDEVLLIEKASSLRKVEQTRDDLVRRLKDYPDAMTRVDGGDVDRLDEALAEKDTREREVESVREEMAETEAARLRTGLEGIAPDDAALDAQREVRRRASAQATEVVRLDEVLAGATRRLESIAADLGVACDYVEALPPVTPQLVRDVRDLLTRRDGERRRLEDLDRLLDSAELEVGESLADPETAREGLRLLAEWLSGTDEYTSAAPASIWLPWALLAGAGVAFGLSDRLGGWPTGLLLTVPALVLGAVQLGLRARRGRIVHTVDRDRVQRSFAGLGLEPPTTWDRAGVGDAMHRLQTTLFETEDARRRDRLRATFSGERQRVAASAAGHADRLAELRSKHGLAASAGDDLADFLGRVTSYREAMAEAADLRGRREMAAAALSTDLAGLDGFLVACGCEGDANIADVAGRLDDLVRRAADFRRLTERADELRKTEIRAIESATKAATTIDGIYTRLDLDPNDRNGLARLVRMRFEWLELSNEFDHCRRSCEHRAEEIAGRPDLLDADVEALEAMRRQSATLADTRDGLLKEQSGLETRLLEIRTDGRFEKARSQLQTNADALAAERDTDLFAAAGGFLIEHLRRQHERDTTPKVLQRARKYFREFTRNAWELEVTGESSGTPAFRAIDTSSRRGHGLSELSDGTRAQLLLATKLAFVDSVDESARVPIFLDESLIAADPRRFEAIAESLSLFLADDSRQIVYLTSDPADCDAWLAVHEQHGPSAATVIHLDEERRVQHGVDAARLARVRSGLLPPPDGRSAAEYGAALGVPPLDLYDTVDSTHLWYLLTDDLELLRRLGNEWNLSTVGQYRSWRDGFDIDDLIDEGSRRRLDGRLRALEALARAWRVGRGRPLRANELGEFVTGSYFEAIAKRLGDAGNDAAVLLAALENDGTKVRGFGPGKIRKLREQLVEEGYIDSRPRPGDAEIGDNVRNELKMELTTGAIDPVDLTGFVSGLLKAISSV